MRAQILIIAKWPFAGRSKTRLSPPCTPEEAAEIAKASLLQTLENVAEVRVADHVLVLDGDPPPRLVAEFEIIRQRGAGLAERLAAAFEDAGGPSVAIGMDTPQATPELLTNTVETLLKPRVDAVLGEASDGGYWAIGLREPDPAVFEAVPMSSPETHASQRRTLSALGLVVADLPLLIDVDSMDDALAVASQIPDTKFAETVTLISKRRYADVS